jgi:outer membrane immunogenic protein
MRESRNRREKCAPARENTLYDAHHVAIFVYGDANRIHHHSFGARHMNRLLAAASALTVLAAASQASAADLAARAPVYTKAPEYAAVSNWTGWYIGGNVGYGWGTNTTDATFLPSEIAFGGIQNGSLRSNTTGVVGGAQFGYNWQTNNFLAGFEADFQGSGVKGSSQQQLLFVDGAPTPSGNIRSSSQELSWFGTVRGRLGFTVIPSFLLYGTGGLAYGQVKAAGNTVFDSGAQLVPANLSTTRTGWAAGAGAEWMFAPGWSAKVEYLHIDLGSVSATGVDTLTPANGVRYTFQNQFDTVRVGVNYHFH